MTLSENGTNATPEPPEAPDVGKKMKPEPAFLSREVACSYDVLIEVDAYGKPEMVEVELVTTLARILDCSLKSARVKRIRRTARRS